MGHVHIGFGFGELLDRLLESWSKLLPSLACCAIPTRLSERVKSVWHWNQTLNCEMSALSPSASLANSSALTLT
jgi:hypothetical protein